MNKSVRILLGLLASLAVLLVLYFLMGGKLMEKFTGASTKVSYYYLPGCGWCQKFMPEWDKFVELAKTEKESGITTEKVNAQENAEKVQSKGITAFPTVHVEKNGKVTEYTGDRTAADLMKFVKSA